MSATDISVVPAPAVGQVLRVDFGGTSVEAKGETAATASAAAAKAAIEASYIMAMRRPRVFDNVRALLLKACEHPQFAYLARFRKPVGHEQNEVTGEWEEKVAEGLSIRFAEEAARVMGNLNMDSVTVYDDAKKKMVRFVTIDLENNTTWAKTITIERTTERTKLKEGQQPLGTRLNGKGKPVFIVEATPAEVAKAEGAEGSKAWRDQILKSLPAHIKGECLQRINEVLEDDAAEDPDKKKKQVFDAFAVIGVMPVHLLEYVGHPLDMLTAAEVANLRTLYTSIEQGETTWAEISEHRRDFLARKAGAAAALAAPAAGAGKPAGTTVVPGNAVDAAVAEARRKREAAAAKTGTAAPDTKPQPKPATQPAAKAAGEGDPAAGAGHTMSTTKQRNAIAVEATAAGFQIGDICEWFGVTTIALLSSDQAEEALRKIRLVSGEQAPEPGSQG